MIFKHSIFEISSFILIVSNFQMKKTNKKQVLNIHTHCFQAMPRVLSWDLGVRLQDSCKSLARFQESQPGLFRTQLGSLWPVDSVSPRTHKSQESFPELASPQTMLLSVPNPPVSLSLVNIQNLIALKCMVNCKQKERN